MKLTPGGYKVIIDFHNHIGKKKGLAFSAENLLEKMDAAGIDKAVVFSFPENIDNGYIAESAAKYPDRLIGFASINPWEEDSEEQLEYCLGTLCLKGLKLHPMKHAYNFDNHMLLDPLFEIAEKYGVPVIAYGMSNVLSTPNMFEEMARTFPNVNLVIAHSGQMYEAKSAISAASRNPNLYLETSAVFAVNIKKQYTDLGPEKILLGTDMPYGDYELEILKIKGEIPDDGALIDVLGGNAMRILGGQLNDYRCP